jgi:hypothetical protein
MPMEMALYTAAALLFVTGAAHSVLGERYILVRLFRRTEVPHLFGGAEFTVRTLRFAWHITTVAWWGLATIIILVAQGEATPKAVLFVLAGTLLVSAAVAAVGSRFRHLSWLVFALVAVLLYAAATNASGVGI